MTRVPTPRDVKLALSVAWLALLVGLMFRLWTTISVPLTLVPDEFNLALIKAALLMSAVLLLTPDFIGYVITAFVLIFVGRGIGWLRWWLVVSLLIGIAFFAFNTLVWSQTGARLVTMPLIGIEMALIAANVLAVVLMFTRASSAWFGMRKQARSAA